MQTAISMLLFMVVVLMFSRAKTKFNFLFLFQKHCIVRTKKICNTEVRIFLNFGKYSILG